MSIDPNILLIVTDQQHADTLAARGASHLQTPALDRLARHGTSYRRNYCTYPLCSPARSSLFTGRMPSETGVFENGNNIRATIPNLGQWLGRHTDREITYSGKWHVRQPHTAVIPGFDVIASGINCKGQEGDKSVTQSCEAYIRSYAGEKPFFLAAMYTQPHDIGLWTSYAFQNRLGFPYPELADELPPLPDNFETAHQEPAVYRQRRQGSDPASEEDAELYWRYYLWGYYRHVEMVDAEIGRLVQAVEDTGHLEDTLIIFTSDHGEGMAEHRFRTKNFLYDAAARVPLIVSWRGVIPEGREESEELASGLDIFPTVCDYWGCPVPEQVRGVSLRASFEQAKPVDREYVAVECHHGSGQAIRSREYKYIAFNNDPVEMLFNMKDDPGETANLAGSPGHRDELERHRDYLRQWLKGLDTAPSVPADCRWRAFAPEAAV